MEVRAQARERGTDVCAARRRPAGPGAEYTFGLWHGGALVPIGKAQACSLDEELLRLGEWVREHAVARFGPVIEVEKALVFEVASGGAHRSARHKAGVALREPRIVRIRWDRSASEADELAALAKWLD